MTTPAATREVPVLLRRPVVLLLAILVVACTSNPPAASVSPSRVTSSASPAPRQSTAAATPTSAGQSPPMQLTEYRSSISRASSAGATDEQLRTVVASDEKLAFLLYQQTAAANNGADVFFSPYSISTSLSMVLPGARGTTAQELASALEVSDATTWDAERNALDQTVGTAQGLMPDQADKAQPLVLTTANAIFGQVGYPFEQPYLDVLARDYGAGVQATDFAQQPEPARKAINAWVGDQTEQRILDLLPPGTIDQLTRAVLVNAI